MASQAVGSSPATGSSGGDARPTNTTSTTYYFAYGSNLHLRQMKRRCPGSKFIGCARLSHYRWQINERGYANVVAAEGHWVDGLVYEIDENDEARLDINEGVSKNAYTKQYMTVMLCRGPASLYRRPTAWIVDKGGPAKVRQMAARNSTGSAQFEHHPQQWQQYVLVYISHNYIVDSQPKEEYVHRINMGVTDARALGIGWDYISNCIRPYVPPNKKSTNKPKKTTTNGGAGGGDGSSGDGGSGGQHTSGAGPAGRDASPNTKNRRNSVPAPRQSSQGAKRNSTHRPTTPSPARNAQAPARQSASPSRPSRQADPPQRASASNVGHRFAGNFLVVPTERRRASSDVGPTPPPLPPRPARRMQSIPVIVLDDRVIRLARLT
ncbi:hypothetical protein B0T10DRAFT_460722 [Thelonectria olida]|uniref:gamma-glutamylcyclotransferase n=1 Tax=Thelonectria olida TaxID=1576542 RepID=A0A9P8W3E9_9HYPO|nr:hypothetical protein B0T10DRAFT_460722 [Thelonectria olida]